MLRCGAFDSLTFVKAIPSIFKWQCTKNGQFASVRPAKVTLTKYCFLINYMENNFLHAHTGQSLRWGSEETLADIEMYLCITNITNSFMTEKNFISGVRNQLVNELLTAPIHIRFHQPIHKPNQCMNVRGGLTTTLGSCPTLYKKYVGSHNVE